MERNKSTFYRNLGLHGVCLGDVTGKTKANAKTKSTQFGTRTRDLRRVKATS